MSQELQNLLDQWIDPNDHIPAELLLNDDHPDHDEFSKNRHDIEQKIFAFSRMMKPKKRELARLLRTNIAPKDIAKRLDKTPKTIYAWAKDPDVIRLTTLMDYHQRLLDGADASHRKGVLWRITLDNEQKRPNIAVQAIQEINRMSGVYNQDNAGNKGNVVNISINGELLPRGGLDDLPETYETRVIEGKVVAE